jgi:hypothetical protein
VPINQNIPDAWSSYVTQVNLGLETVPSVLYDTLSYTSASTTNLNFFQQTNVALDISNMKQAGMLSNPEAFLIQNIRVFYRTTLSTADQGASAAAMAGLENDKVILANTGIAQLTIGNKQYGPWPIWMLPAAAGWMGTLAAAGAEAAGQVTGYGQLGGPLYPLFPNLMLSPLQAFRLTLQWPSGAVTLSATMSIEVLFDGQLARSIQ